MAEDPTASTARPIQLNPASHTAHVDSADDFWPDFLSVIGPLFPVVTAGVGAVGYALGVEANPEPLGGELNPEVSQVPEGEEILELGELGAVGLSTAQVDSVSPDDWQEGGVAAADSSFDQVKGTPLANPTTALAPRPQPVAAAPTVLPSSVIAGIAASKALSSTPGGRKMMQDAHNAPPCCNSCTVKEGDTLQSIAATYGASTNGPAILQAINGLPGTTVTPGQTLMLPCGRILAYYTGFNAAAAASKEAPAPTSSG
ncbi:g5867 [Coccomyxa elongata]